MSGLTEEQAMKVIVSRNEAKREVEKHGLDWTEFVRDHGEKPNYKGSTVLHWLGY